MVKKLRAVRIKERDLEELARLAKKEDETVSSLIQRAVREFLDKMKAQRLGRQQRVEIASLQIRTSAQRRTTPQPAAVRWFVPLRLQQGFGSQPRTLREKGTATGLRGPVCAPAKLEDRARVPLRGTSASVAASVEEPGTSVHQLLSKTS